MAQHETLTVHLFGEFELRDGAGSMVPGVSRRGAEALAYLLLHAERPQRRETLMALLWPEVSETSARRSLRQLLWRLRPRLAPAASGGEPLLCEDDAVRLDPRLRLDCDAVRFRTLAVGGGDARTLDEAVTLYRGDLLEAWDAWWCRVQREALRTQFLMLLDRLMDHCLHVGEVERGITYGYRALGCDPARERAYRRLMRLHARAGDRSGALRLYRRCREALADELDVAPDARTRALAARIRDGDKSRRVMGRPCRPSLAPAVMRLA